MTELNDWSSVSVRRSMLMLSGAALIGLAIAGYGLFTAKGTRSRSVPPEAVALVNQRPILRSDFVVAADGGRSRAEVLAAATAAVAAIRGGTPVASVIQRYRLQDSGVFVTNGQVDDGDIFEFAAQAKLKPRVFEALKPLNAGDVSDPVEVDDGVHLIYVRERKRPLAQGFEAAHDQVWSDYKTAARARVNEGNLRYLRRRADIMVAADYAAAEARAAAQPPAAPLAPGAGGG